MVRGEVLRVRRPRGAVGREQRGARFAVVVQADELLPLSTVLVAPTSKSAMPLPFRPVIDLRGQQTRVIVDQTCALAAERLGASAGRLSATELRALDEALALVLGL